MKTTAILFLAYLALCVQCSVPENKSTKKEISTQPIKVGVFDGHGGAQTCIWETVAAIRLDPEMEVCTITTADIANNAVSYTHLDVYKRQLPYHAMEGLYATPNFQCGRLYESCRLVVNT